MKAMSRFLSEKQRNEVIKEFLRQQAAFYGQTQDWEQIHYDLFGDEIFKERKN